jgi:hypothetical protein
VASTLRRAVDVVGVLTGVGALIVVGFVNLNRYRTQQQTEITAAGLREFDRTIAVQAASGAVERTRRGWPATMDPAWFGGSPPRNTLMPPDAPWVEIAPEIEANLLDPPARVAPDRYHAGFWYNPYQGVVRARVPLTVSESRSVELYNRINGRSIKSGFEPNPELLKPAPPPPVEDEKGDAAVAEVSESGDKSP